MCLRGTHVKRAVVRRRLHQHVRGPSGPERAARELRAGEPGSDKKVLEMLDKVLSGTRLAGRHHKVRPKGGVGGQGGSAQGPPVATEETGRRGWPVVAKD